MENYNLRRFTITGKVNKILKRLRNGKESHMVVITKINEEDWCLNVSEELLSKCRTSKEAVFKVAVVFKNDDIYGKLIEKESYIEEVYIKGEDISEEDYHNCVEGDKSWMCTEEMRSRVAARKRKRNILGLLTISLMAMVMLGMAHYAWVTNLGNAREYENYNEVDGMVTSVEYEEEEYEIKENGKKKKETKTYIEYTYLIEYTAMDGKTYEIKEVYKEDEARYCQYERVLLIVNPDNYEEAYTASYNDYFGYNIPTRFFDIKNYYYMNVLGLLSILGAIAMILLYINGTVARFFRLSIPVLTGLMSYQTGYIYNEDYYFGVWICIFVFAIMIAIRIKKGFKQKTKMVIK